MTEFSGSAAMYAARNAVFDPSNLVPLGHPGQWENPAQAVRAITGMVESPHPDDQLACNAIRGLFRACDSDYVPDVFPRMDEMHRDVLDWTQQLRPRHLARFLGWNLERQADHQARMERDVPLMQDVTMVHTRLLVDHGLLAPNHVPVIESVLEGVDYYAMDSFASGAFLARGLYLSDGRRVCFRNEYEKGPDGLARQNPQLTQTHTHESLHAFAHNTNSGLSVVRLEDEDPSGSSWVDEALTAHLANAASHGKPETISPEQRGAKDDHGLPGALSLLSAVSRAARPQIGADLWAAAYREPMDGRRQLARHELHLRLGRLSAAVAPELNGRNLVYAVNEHLESVPLAHTGRVIGHWLARLVS